MKIVYIKHFGIKYPTKPVENPCRATLPAYNFRDSDYELVVPAPVSQEDIRRAHGLQHIEPVQSSGLYGAASIAASGTIAAELALQGEPTLALVRPSGHHAAANGQSRSSSLT